MSAACRSVSFVPQYCPPTSLPSSGMGVCVCSRVSVIKRPPARIHHVASTLNPDRTIPPQFYTETSCEPITTHSIESSNVKIGYVLGNVKVRKYSAEEPEKRRMEGARTPSRILPRDRLQHRIHRSARVAEDLHIVVVVVVERHLVETEIELGILKVAEEEELLGQPTETRQHQ